MTSGGAEPDGATWHPDAAPLPRADVVVVGAGPAAWAMASACAGQRLRTVLVAPDPWARWPATYGMWLDQLESSGLGPAETPHPEPIARAWASVAVGTDGRGLRSVARAYGLLDNDAVAARLRSRAIEHDITLVRDTARGAAPDVGGAVVGLASGRAITTTVVVDASGHPGALVARGRAAVPGWQVAAGIVARFDEPPIEPGTCMLMDWRTSSAEPAGAAPTFLYGMDLGDGTYLVEETVLAARRPPSVGALAARLERRLERAGTPPREVVAREAVHIPMGVPVPPRQRVVAYGAAAGLIHPATGYSVAASLARAPAVALAIRQAVDRRVTPAEVSAAAWRAVWPAARRRVRALEQYGLGAELAMDARQLGDFFDAFFALPVRDWAAYLDGGRSLLATGRVMRAVFAGSPAAVRRRLVTGDVRALRDLLG